MDRINNDLKELSASILKLMQEKLTLEFFNKFKKYPRGIKCL